MADPEGQEDQKLMASAAVAVQEEAAAAAALQKRLQEDEDAKRILILQEKLSRARQGLPIATPPPPAPAPPVLPPDDSAAVLPPPAVGGEGASPGPPAPPTEVSTAAAEPSTDQSDEAVGAPPEVPTAPPAEEETPQQSTEAVEPASVPPPLPPAEEASPATEQSAAAEEAPTEPPVAEAAPVEATPADGTGEPAEETAELLFFDEGAAVDPQGQPIEGAPDPSSLPEGAEAVAEENARRASVTAREERQAAEAEEDGKYLSEELRNKDNAIISLSDLFTKIDTNENGKISIVELETVFGDHAEHFMQFLNRDTETLNEISCDEWVRGIIKHTGEMSEQQFQRDWIDRMRTCVDLSVMLGAAGGDPSKVPGSPAMPASPSDPVALESLELLEPPGTPPLTKGQLILQTLEDFSPADKAAVLTDMLEDERKLAIEAMTPEDKAAVLAELEKIKQLQELDAKYQTVIRKGIFEMLVSRPLHSLKTRVDKCNLDTEMYGKDKVKMANDVIGVSDPEVLVKELKNDLGMLGITSLATNNEELAAQVEYALSLRADREKAHEAALAAKQKQEEAEEEAQRQVDKTERIRLAKLKQEKDDARTNMRTIRKVEGEAWAVVDAERQQTKDKQLRNRAKLQRRQEREHQVALEAKQEADRIKSEETTEEGRRNLHQMWAVEEAFFQKKCEELAQVKANKKKQERKAKRKHEAEMRRQAEQEEKARLEHREQALLHKSASQAMWDRDYQTRRARIKAAADKEQAEAQALAQRKKWIADQNACQRDERYNLTCQIEAERSSQNSHEQQAKCDRMVRHTELALHSAMVHKHEKMMAMKHLEQQWNDQVANRHQNYQAQWSAEHRMTEMFRQQRSKSVGKFYQLQTPNQGTADVRFTRSSTTIGARPVPSAQQMHSPSPLSQEYDGRIPRGNSMASMTHPLPMLATKSRHRLL